jgi:hypothetical protein
MSVPHADARAVLLNNGHVMILGGASTTRAEELYDPKSGRFVLTSLVSDFGLQGSENQTATLLHDGNVLMIEPGATLPASLYDSAAGKFRPISYRLGIPDTVVLLADGRVLFYGSSCREPAFLTLYDPKTGLFTPSSFKLPSTLSSQYQWCNPTATLLADGRVLFEGGWGGGNMWAPAVPWAALFDPATGFHIIGQMRFGEQADGSAWHEPIGPMKADRSHQTATLLPNGSVLIAGGEDTYGDSQSSAELFVP